MPYELNYRDGGFIVSFSGKVTLEELNQANGEIHGHSEFDIHNYQIVDLLNADLSPVSLEDTELPAQMDRIASETRWRVKVALVVEDSHGLRIVNGYVNHARRLIPRWKFGVFSTRDHAIKWARSAVSQFGPSV